MKVKKTLRLIVLMLFIAIACILPFPLSLKRKDDLPKFPITQVDLEEENEKDDIKKDAFG